MRQEAAECRSASITITGGSALRIRALAVDRQTLEAAAIRLKLAHLTRVLDGLVPARLTKGGRLELNDHES